MTGIRPWFTVIATLGLAACGDSSPTSGRPQLDEAAFQVLAEGAMEANDQAGTPLPSLDNLLRRTFRAIREQGGHPQGQRLLRAGQTLNAIIAVLGPGVSEEALNGVDQGLARLDGRIAGRTLPGRIQKIVNQARAQADRGHEALAAERYAGALGAALASADLIRSLAPRFQARESIERATRAFNAAREAVEADPTEDETAALNKARRLRNAATDAFEAKEYRRAWNLAHQSLALSQQVLQGRSGG
jgi:hypothetical protein